MGCAGVRVSLGRRIPNIWCVHGRVGSGHLDDQQSFFVAHLSADSYSGAQIVWADCGHRSGVDTWVVFPYAVYTPVHWIWEACLATLLLTLLVLLAVRLDEAPSLWAWVGFGALWGVAALTNPVVLTVLPFLGAWVYFRLNRRPPFRWAGWAGPAGAAALVFVLCVAPWFARKYRTLAASSLSAQALLWSCASGIRPNQTCSGETGCIPMKARVKCRRCDVWEKFATWTRSGTKRFSSLPPTPASSYG